MMWSFSALTLSRSVFAAAETGSGRWIRPTRPGDPLVWGRTDGSVFGLPSEGGMPGPRGLIRVGIWNGAPELINFVAVEPVTEGIGPRQSRMAFSELEPSALDAPHRGKRLWTTAPGQTSPLDAVSGELETFPATRTRPFSIQQLTVRIEVEPFTANGAHVHLLARMQSHRPQEIAFAVFHHVDSAPIEELTLTATMGNYARLRLLWLKNGVVDSRILYDGYDGDGFIDRENYPVDEMLRVGDGDALVMCSSNEEEPSATVVERSWWTYKSAKLTQYWRVPAKHIQPDLRVKVNGRRVYWGGKGIVIPYGISFENFEVRQRYVPGQSVVFGLSAKEPWEFLPRVPRPERNPDDT